MTKASPSAAGSWGASAAGSSAGQPDRDQALPADVGVSAQQARHAEFRNRSVERDFGQDPINAYLATALTNLATEARRHVFAVSDVAADACSEFGVTLYQPRAATDPVNNPEIPDHEVFRFDRQRVRRSDLLIYLADYPSTGAGLELVFAYEAMIPIVALANTDTTISRMVTGIPGALFVVRYRSLPDLRDSLVNQLEELLPLIIPRRAAIKKHDRMHLGERIRQLRQARGMSHEDLSRVLSMEFFSPKQIQEWEGSSDLESNLSIITVREIAAALNADVADLLA